MSGVAWGVVMLFVVSAIGLFARFAWNDAVYGGVFVWTLMGVAVKAGQSLEERTYYFEVVRVPVQPKPTVEAVPSFGPSNLRAC